MNNFKLFAIAVLTFGAITVAANPETAVTDYTTIEWTDLIPAADLEALSNPPSYITDIEEGSEAELAGQVAGAIAAASDDRYQQALVSTRVVATYDQQAVRLAGFIVPLDFDDDMNITEFFLVPYFGACLHLPPPPPNQIIHISDATGIALDEIFTPFWISGILSTRLLDTEVATSAYSMTLDNYELYKDEQS